MRIHILGASGSGVSTLGEKLAEALGLPAVDCDEYYWEKTDPPFQRATAIPARQAALLSELLTHGQGWVLTGSMDSWSEPFEPLFTHVIFLFVPRAVRVERLKAREQARWGTRVAPGGDMFDAHLKFLAWADQYEEGVQGGRSLPRHEMWLQRRGWPLTRIEGDMPAEEVQERALRFLRG